MEPLLNERAAAGYSRKTQSGAVSRPRQLSAILFFRSRDTDTSTLIPIKEAPTIAASRAAHVDGYCHHRKGNRRHECARRQPSHRTRRGCSHRSHMAPGNVVTIRIVAPSCVSVRTSAICPPDYLDLSAGCSTEPPKAHPGVWVSESTDDLSALSSLGSLWGRTLATLWACGSLRDRGRSARRPSAASVGHESDDIFRSPFKRMDKSTDISSASEWPLGVSGGASRCSRKNWPGARSPTHLGPPLTVHGILRKVRNTPACCDGQISRRFQ
jgi:hypothetical protein